MSSPTIEVDANALHELLRAVIGPPHLLREMLVIAGMDPLLKDKPDALTILLNQYNAWAEEKIRAARS